MVAVLVLAALENKNDETSYELECKTVHAF